MSEVSQTYEYTISSDGSGSPLHSGGAACILESASRRLKYKLAAYIGPSTGNEAELMAGFLAFTAATAITRSSVVFSDRTSPAERPFGGNPPDLAAASQSVLWQTDSQYLIRTVIELQNGRRKDANLPNHRFWHALSLGWKDFNVVPLHVRARSGHRRNEACDHASKWVQRQGPKLLQRHGEERIGRLRTSVPAESWQLFDLSKTTVLLRTAELSAVDGAFQELQLGLQQRFSEFS